jgi:hypothetical protein
VHTRKLQDFTTHLFLVIVRRFFVERKHYALHMVLYLKLHSSLTATQLSRRQWPTFLAR